MGRKAHDLTGQRFGRLVAVRREGSSGPSRHAVWYCVCDCGNGAMLRADKLIEMNTQSCGCHRKIQAKLNTEWQQRDENGRFVRKTDNPPHTPLGLHMPGPAGPDPHDGRRGTAARLGTLGWRRGTR